MSTIIATSEYIYRKIKEDITCGELLPGERLITEKIAAKYNVSRTPIRETLKRLESDGLVSSMRNTGVVVAKKSMEYIDDLYAVRIELECLAIRAVVERWPTAEELKGLKICCDAVTHAETLGTLEKADFDFHMAICRLSKMQPVIDIMEKQMILLSSFRLSPQGMASRSLARDEIVKEEHNLLVETICKDDADGAVMLMRQHLSSAVEHIRQSKMINPE